MDFNINKKGDANTFSISYLLHIVELYVTRKTTQKSLKKTDRNSEEHFKVITESHALRRKSKAFVSA